MFPSFFSPHYVLRSLCSPTFAPIFSGPLFTHVIDTCFRLLLLQHNLSLATSPFVLHTQSSYFFNKQIIFLGLFIFIPVQLAFIYRSQRGLEKMRSM